MHSVKELCGLPYPGRGIIIGRSCDGNKAVIAYFIMGRSENSRNRVFVEEGENLRTKAFDESKCKDPSLIIYYPVKTTDKEIIVTNGDQTDTIYDFLAQGKTFEDALSSRTFEPDPPNFTPRISALVKIDGEELFYKMSILKTMDGNENTCVRNFYNYSGIKPGTGHFIHTYKENVDPLPSFEGEPKVVTINGSAEEFAQELWSVLDSDNKVSLFVRTIDLKDHSVQTVVVNKNK